MANGRAAAGDRITTSIRLERAEYLELKIFAIKRGQELCDVLGGLARMRLARARKSEAQRQGEQQRAGE